MSMINWRDTLISADLSIIKAIELIDTCALQIALVTDEQGHLLGTVSDGDIRRGILKGVSLSDPVSNIMFTEPSVAGVNDGRETILALMKKRQLRQIPVVDEERHVLGLEIWAELIDVHELDNVVVLMAGGLGTRLGPLTKDCPKPLLKVGKKPVLETILESCKEYGFRRFYLSVNYKAEMLKEYFGNGARFGVEINYLHESKRLGTAGALGLLPERPDLPILVMNGDVLTKVNFQQLMNFHNEHNAVATMCVREYDFQVPFGVVNLNKHRLAGIVEKPVHNFFVNAGIYVLNPESLDHIPANEQYDMPTLFEQLLASQAETAAFPIREYWLDIGQVADYERANGEYAKEFE